MTELAALAMAVAVPFIPLIALPLVAGWASRNYSEKMQDDREEGGPE